MKSDANVAWELLSLCRILYFASLYRDTEKLITVARVRTRWGICIEKLLDNIVFISQSSRQSFQCDRFVIFIDLRRSSFREFNELLYNMRMNVCFSLYVI